MDLALRRLQFSLNNATCRVICNQQYTAHDEYDIELVLVISHVILNTPHADVVPAYLVHRVLLNALQSALLVQQPLLKLLQSRLP